jgi:pimeloyl-ACP methyl ester carboxylesterase
MTVTDTARGETRGHVRAGAVDLWVDRRGTGPDVLLIAGLSDTAEAWEAQLGGLADRYRLTAYDTRGAGRSPMLPDGATVADMADDAAELLRVLGVERAHVAGFSGGSMTAQELALRHPELVSSLVLVSTWARSDAYLRAVADAFHWLVDRAPSERAMLEAFFLWIYTARAHEDGTVASIIDAALSFPHGQPPEGFHRQLRTWMGHDTLDRLAEITVPTLVIAGSEDIITPVRLGRAVADRIPDARFVVLDGEAHQPFQESPDAFNALVDAFWAEVDGHDH